MRIGSFMFCDPPSPFQLRINARKLFESLVAFTLVPPLIGDEMQGLGRRIGW